MSIQTQFSRYSQGKAGSSRPGRMSKVCKAFLSVNSTMLRIAESISSRLARTRPIKAQLLIAPPLVASVSQQAIEYATPAEKKIAFIANVGASGKHVEVTA